MIKITPPDKLGAQPSKPSKQSNSHGINGLSLDGSWTVGDGAGATVQSTVQNSPLIYNGLDCLDGLDGCAPNLSGDANRPALGPPGDSLDDFT
jgi:hypothetical protein